MELSPGKTIFDKMETDYDVFRQPENSIKSYIKYLRKTLKTGDEPWYINSKEETYIEPVVRLFTNLEQMEKTKIINEAMALFPEIFGKSQAKYQKVATWLVAKHQVACTSLRDSFTAGGQGDVTINFKTYCGIPRIFLNLRENISQVKSILKNMPEDDLSYYWEDSFKKDEKPVKQWVSMFLSYSKETMPENEKFLKDLIDLFGK
jgi:hypothetical protein